MRADWDRRARRAIVAGIVVRVVYGLVLHPPQHYLTSDMAQYVQRAQRLAAGGPVPHTDFFLPVGTQALLSLPMRVLGTGHAGLWGDALLWCLLSCAFPWLAWRWAREVLDSRAAAITAMGCALSPLAIIYGGYFASELPALVLLPAALWLLYRTGARGGMLVGAGAGVLAVALLAVRTQFVLNLATAGLPLLLALGRRRAALIGVVAGALVAGVALLMLAGGGPIFGENGGVNFFYGHCDARQVRTADLTFENPVRAQQDTGSDFRFATTPADSQSFFYRRGWHCITADPARQVVLAGRSIADMTATSIPFPPYAESDPVLLVAEVANIVFFLVLVVLAGWALTKGRRIDRLLLAHMGCAFLTAVVFLGEPRYRVPYDLFGWALLGSFLARRGGLGAVAGGEAQEPLPGALDLARQ